MLVLPSSIDSYITAREHFGALEALLAGSVEELERLKKQRPKFGEKLTKEKLQELAPTVVDKVRLFLDVPTRPPYKISLGAGAFAMLEFLGVIAHNKYMTVQSEVMSIFWTTAYFGLFRVMQMRSHYNFKEHKLVIAKLDTVSAVDHIAHEYTHRIQHSFMVTEPNAAEEQLDEGNSFRVAFHVANAFANATGNPAYVLDSVRHSVEQLGYAYKTSARQNRLPVSRALKKHSGIFGIFPPAYWQSHRKGYVAMHLAEALHGEGVQKLAVRADYSFMAHPLTTQARAH